MSNTWRRGQVEVRLLKEPTGPVWKISLHLLLLGQSVMKHSFEVRVQRLPARGAHRSGVEDPALRDNQWTVLHETFFRRKGAAIV